MKQTMDEAGAGGARESVAAASQEKAKAALATLNEDGSRRWIRPRLSHGRFLTRRRAAAYVLIALFTLIPYVKINGWPAMLLDLSARRFHIFGVTFLPTDTLMLALFMVSLFLTVFFLTAMFGRVWCGWACPQTVYMEFLYRPLERLFDGTPGRAARNKFQGSGLARVLKYVVYFVCSCYLAHTFLAYFVGVEQLEHWVTQSPLEHPGPFMVMAVVTGLMMFDFAFFREQTCLVACPYGRFQSVMLDRQSLIVSYDERRGEPRGRKTNVHLKVVGDGDSRTGDCVDCKLCVTTCPTGIDIRNGLQMECVSCTQCIDACDGVMAKLGRPLGLIRYTSQAALAGEKPKVLRPRVVIYPVIVAALMTGFLVVFLGRGAADLTVVRGRGAPFAMLDVATVANQVKIKVVNRTARKETYTLSAEGTQGERSAAGVALHAEDNPVTLGPGEMRTVPAQIVAPMAAFSGHGTLDVRVRLSDGEKFSTAADFKLVGPATHEHEERERTEPEREHKEHEHKEND
ncbi:MAG: cytochrome c oxidase accessory protein CcoG [Tepidisphaera sp.]|nr:cytochrome c oxidase accessory protein CcoG [Tepidisphaera sp.]